MTNIDEDQTPEDDDSQPTTLMGRFPNSGMLELLMADRLEEKERERLRDIAFDQFGNLD
ncbi:MAG: hypothetical protein JZU63_14145 [Rhodoferax sp.]|jgi:hypothetical protein|nr:hypothetical protein [Rhodoferax sp.]